MPAATSRRTTVGRSRSKTGSGWLHERPLTAKEISTPKPAPSVLRMKIVNVQQAVRARVEAKDARALGDLDEC